MDEIFIGYSRRDSDAASAICDYLIRAGFSCYLDIHSIPGGDVWMKSIPAAIGGCHVYVVILSANTVNSQWVDMELFWGIQSGKRFVPVTLQPDVPLPTDVRFALARYQFVDASGGVEAALPAIGAAVARFVDPVRHPLAYSDGTTVTANANFSQTVDFSASDLLVPLLGERRNQIVVSGRSCKVASRPDENCVVPLGRPTLGEFVLEMVVRRAAGPEAEYFGLEFGQSHPGHYYQLVLNGDGAASIQTHKETGWTVRWHSEQGRKPWARSARVDFRAVRKGSSLHLFMDGSHVASCEDVAVREGQLRLFAGKGLAVDFSEVQVHGFDLEKAYREAWAHRAALEQREARAILERVVACNPSFCPAGASIPAADLLAERRPDYRETVLIAVGDSTDAQVGDFPTASYLRSAIDAQGKGSRFRWAATVSAGGLLVPCIYSKCAVISVGGPDANEFTRTRSSNFTRDPLSTTGVEILHNIPGTSQCAVLWGADTRDTAEAVRRFVDSGRLTEFLRNLWASTDDADAVDRAVEERNAREAADARRRAEEAQTTREAEQRRHAAAVAKKEQEELVAHAIAAAVTQAELRWKTEQERNAEEERTKRAAAAAEQAAWEADERRRATAVAKKEQEELVAHAVAAAVTQAELRWKTEQERNAEEERTKRAEAAAKRAELEADEQAEAEADWTLWVEAERRAREEIERKAQAEAEKKAREEERARDEAQRMEAERKAREAEWLRTLTGQELIKWAEDRRRARELADLLAREEATRQRRAREQAEYSAREEAARKPR